MNNCRKTVLKNGLPLISIPVKNARTTTVLVVFKTGSKNEERANNGLSHFLEHMFFKGTDKRPNTLSLSGEMDALGGEYNAFTSKEYTGYWFKVAGDKTAKGLDILSDMLLHSRFDQEEIDREKGVIIEELNMYQDNPRLNIEDVFESCLYGDTPAGWDTIGTKENIRRFRRQDFLDYFKRQYGAQNAYIIMAGAVRPADEKMAARLFSEFSKNKPRSAAKVVEKQAAPRLLASPKKTDQTVVSLGVRAFALGHPDEFKLRLLAAVVGGSMSSRLFISLRERRGLAYYVHTEAEFYDDCGYLTTEAGIPGKKMEEAMSIILGEYRRLASELVPEEELRRVKDMLKGRLQMQLEASDNLANWYARQALYRRQMLSPEDVSARIEAVTARSLRDLAKKIFRNDRLNMAYIGQEKAEPLKKLLRF